MVRMGKRLKYVSILIQILKLYNSEHFKVVAETSAPKFMPHAQFVKPLPTNPTTQSIPIRFVLTLDPPMPVSDEVSQKLLNVIGLIDMTTLSTTTNTAIKINNPSRTQSLEDMLVTEIKEDALHESNLWISVSEI